jgi:hypothetical protein
MQKRYRLATAVLTLAGVAACGQKAQQPSEDLRRDLEQVGSSGIELAPNGTGTQVISAIEQGPAGTVKTATPQIRATPAPSSPRVKAPSAPTPSVVAEAPQPLPEVKAVEQPVPQPVVAQQPVAAEPVDRAPAAQRPAPIPLPSTQRAPKGGWKTTGDVIRNAPFPINP